MTTHYRKPDGSVFGFEDDQIYLVTEDMTLMSDAEVLAFFNPPTPATAPVLTLEEIARAVIYPTERAKLTTKLAQIETAATKGKP